MCRAAALQKVFWGFEGSTATGGKRILVIETLMVCSEVAMPCSCGINVSDNGARECEFLGAAHKIIDFEIFV